MIICATDLETSGLNLDSSILQIACILYDTNLKSFVECWESLVWDNNYPEPNQEALEVNGLKIEELQTNGMHPKEALSRAKEYMDRSSAIVGHNCIGYDKHVYLNGAKNYGVTLPERIWIDSKVDFDYPKSTSKRLTHLAADHGVLLPGSHRALIDCLMMVNVISHYDIDKAVEKAKSPIIKITACPGREKNEELKKNRYRWDPLFKYWWKEIREFDFEKEKLAVSFDIRINNGQKETKP